MKRKKIRRHSVWVTSRYLNFPYRFGKFLCLTADIFARDPRDARDNPNEGATAVPHRKVKFMIDSGSDIVTVHKDLIEELCLPTKGRAKQEGPGGETRELPLYNACLGIGGKTLNIEVRSQVLAFCKIPKFFNVVVGNLYGFPLTRNFITCVNVREKI